MAHFAVMTFSAIWTFSRLSWADILSLMQFAPTEMRALSGIPLSGAHLAEFIGLPLLATLALTFYAKRCFAGARRTWDPLRRMALS